MPEICWEEIAEKNFIFHFSFWCLIWYTNPGFKSNKPTHYPLDYSDFTERNKSIYWDLLEIYLRNKGNWLEIARKCCTQFGRREGPVYASLLLKFVKLVSSDWSCSAYTRKYRTCDWKCAWESINMNHLSFSIIEHFKHQFLSDFVKRSLYDTL